ncbi:MAG: hypothetical protein JRJ19_05680 [Deltaproteobacteria bacterium]|nr:hypothetical protein [Deltaproteobacteria bacterium]MBW1871533.1 hypothetical protein [Deltaproteobacteria bacterium]
MERYKKLSDYQAPKPKGQVGTDIDAWCTRCKRMLTHTVLAKTEGRTVRVVCNTCSSEHKYYPEPPGSRRTTSKRKTGSRSSGSKKIPAAARVFEDAIRDKDMSKPAAYHPNTTFEIDQAIIHGKFGLGIVTEVKPRGRIVVSFEDAVRVMVHARG